MTRNEQSFSNFDTTIMNSFLQNFEREIDSTNWYAYCNNDPINYIDPLGLCTESDESKNQEQDLTKYDPVTNPQPTPDGYNVYATEDSTYVKSRWNKD